MKLSNFEIAVLDALIEGDSEEGIIRQQLAAVSVVERDYTGVGLYTNLNVSEDSPLLSKNNRYIEEAPKIHLEHPELDAGAGALLWFKDGKVSTLECYTYEGDWPKNEGLFIVSI